MVDDHDDHLDRLEWLADVAEAEAQLDKAGMLYWVDMPGRYRPTVPTTKCVVCNKQRVHHYRPTPHTRCDCVPF